MKRTGKLITPLIGAIAGRIKLRSTLVVSKRGPLNGRNCGDPFARSEALPPRRHR